LEWSAGISRPERKNGRERSEVSLKTFKIGFVLASFVLFAMPAFALSDVDNDWLWSSDLGYVGDGATLEYSHAFEYDSSAITLNSIDSSMLFIVVADDQWRDESETASIDLNGVDWASGNARLNIFWGNVTAELVLNDGVVNVSVTSTGGDFRVVASLLRTAYSYELGGFETSDAGGAGASPTPEPSAALVFAIGALVMQRKLRRGLRSS
jgi:hypothetical protein